MFHEEYILFLGVVEAKDEFVVGKETFGHGLGGTGLSPLFRIRLITRDALASACSEAQPSRWDSIRARVSHRSKEGAGHVPGCSGTEFVPLRL
jgi:hypothetical protein